MGGREGEGSDQSSGTTCRLEVRVLEGLYFCRLKRSSRDARNSLGFVMFCIFAGSVFHRIAAELKKPFRRLVDDAMLKISPWANSKKTSLNGCSFLSPGRKVCLLILKEEGLKMMNPFVGRKKSCRMLSKRSFSLRFRTAVILRGYPTT